MMMPDKLLGGLVVAKSGNIAIIKGVTQGERYALEVTWDTKPTDADNEDLNSVYGQATGQTETDRIVIDDVDQRDAAMKAWLKGDN